jgi:hypothetical protein
VGAVQLLAEARVRLELVTYSPLDEAAARELLAWLEAHEAAQPAATTPVGAQAMLGFARRFRSETRSTAEWMRELREGEHA